MLDAPLNHLSGEANSNDVDLRLVAESMAHIVWIAAPDGTPEYLNRHGGDARDWLALVHPEEAGQAQRGWNDAVRSGTPFQIDCRMRGGGGNFRWHACHGLPVRGADGSILKWMGTATDIDERKRAEAGLREAEQQFRGMVEQSISGTYIIQDGRLAYVNKRYANLFGYGSADELIGRDPLSLAAEKDRAIVMENISRPIDGDRQDISYEFTGVRADGSTIEVGVHGSRATHRGHPALIGLIQDISEKKRAAAQKQSYVAQLESAFMRTVEVAMTLSEMRDPYTAGHERRVAEIAVAIGTEFGFDSHRLQGLRVAGYLHDIGKITVPTEILSKSRKLSTAEFTLIKEHPQASHDVLKTVEFPWPIAQMVLQHHERMDGSGYPRGLSVDAILPEARILAVADVVEAMSSHRPYRAALGMERALAEIERGRGTLYDPAVAEACLRLFREQGYVGPD